jgi:hypothetical protein
MRSRMNHTVSAAQIHDLAGGILQQSLALVDRGRKCTVRNLLLVLFFAASRASSIFDACLRLAQEYRKRYGIETSYRQMNQGRIRTCCRDPRLRLLLVGIALVLRNLWVWLHRTKFASVRGERIELRLELLRLRTMLLMLQRCAEFWLGSAEYGMHQLIG